MASRDLVHNLAPVQLLAPSDNAHTNFNSLVLDTAGFEAAGILLSIGSFTGEDGSNFLTAKIQESDDTVGADFTDVVAGDLQGAFVPINAAGKLNSLQFVGYIGNKRYIRLVGTYTGTAVSASLVSAAGLLGHAQYQPVTAPAAITAS